MALHLIQADVELPALYRWWGRRHPSHRTLDDGFALHGLLTQNIGRSVLKPFRFLSSGNSEVGSLYAYSTLDAAAVQESIAEVAEPSFGEIVSRVCSKPMPSTFPANRMLGFDVKIRPTRRGRRADGSIGERDAFLALATAQPDEPLDRESVYRQWLAEKFERGGARLRLESTSMVSFQRKRSVRHREKGGLIEAPEAVFHGNLVVERPSDFASLIAHGLGRHKSYGFGMLLLRPARVG